jgi:hypothetical protein
MVRETRTTDHAPGSESQDIESQDIERRAGTGHGRADIGPRATGHGPRATGGAVGLSGQGAGGPGPNALCGTGKAGEQAKRKPAEH